MHAKCRLCKINLVAENKQALMVLMLSHVLQKHYDDAKYEAVMKDLIKIMKGDFILSEK